MKELLDLVIEFQRVHEIHRKAKQDRAAVLDEITRWFHDRSLSRSDGRLPDILIPIESGGYIKLMHTPVQPSSHLEITVIPKL